MSTIKSILNLFAVSKLKKDIVASFIGKGFSALMTLVFVPIYIKFLGIESFALVGVYFSLQAIFALFGIGLSSTINREMARLANDHGHDRRLHDLMHTLERIHWLVGILIGLVVIGMSSPIADHWLNEQQLHANAIRSAIVLIGITMAMMWPFSFYSSGLLGLQRHIKLNIITSIFSAIRGIGAVFVLWMIEPTIHAFFTWQIVITALQTVITAKSLRSSLPRPVNRPKFQKQVLLDTWQFTTGVSAVSMLGTFLRQIDKIILSKMLPLDIFGYYALANMIVSYLAQAIMPIYTVMFPRFAQLVAQNASYILKELYHRGCQFVSVMILPFAMLLVIFSKDILTLWQLDATTVKNAHLIVSLLAIGRLFNVFIRLPYALQLAHGWVKLAFYTNLFAAIILVPVIIWLTIEYGVFGGALALIIVNLTRMFVFMHFMHQKILKGELRRWYIQDLGRPLAAVSFVVIGGQLLLPAQLPAPVLFAALIGILLLSVLAAAIAAPNIRALMKNQYSLSTQFTE